MRWIYAPAASVAAAPLSLSLPAFRDRPIEFRAFERVSEAKLKLGQHVGSRVDGHRLSDRLGNRSQLVDTVAVVSMGVRDDHRIETVDLGSEQLLAKIGSAVDQQPLACALKEDG